jgi:hypothetical protein
MKAFQGLPSPLQASRNTFADNTPYAFTKAFAEQKEQNGSVS